MPRQYFRITLQEKEKVVPVFCESHIGWVATRRRSAVAGYHTAHRHRQASEYVWTVRCSVSHQRSVVLCEIGIGR